MANYTNADGLTQEYGRRVAENSKTRAMSSYGAVQQLVVQLDWDNYPDYDEDASGGSTFDSFGDKQAFIPANSFIVAAYVVSEVTWASGTDVSIGTYVKAGTAIDADGIDATIATAALTLGDTVVCNGAQVGGVLTVGTANAYIKATFTGTFTAGKSRLIIEYV